MEFSGISHEAKVNGILALLFLVYSFFGLSPAVYRKLRTIRHGQLKLIGREQLLNSRFMQIFFENPALGSCIARSVVFTITMVWYDWAFVPAPAKYVIATGVCLTVPLGGYCYYQLIKSSVRPYSSAEENDDTASTNFYS